MSEPSQSEKLAEAFGDLDLIPLGTRKAQEQGNGSAVYLPFPQPHARNQGIEQSTSIEIGLHPPTGAVVFLPPDSN